METTNSNGAGKVRITERILLAVGLSLLLVWAAARFHGRTASDSAIERFYAGTSQAPQTFIVNGQPTPITVVQMNGHSYVDLEVLAHAANASLSFNGNQISLTLPGAADGLP